MRQQVFAFSDILFAMTDRYNAIHFSIDLNVSHRRQPKNENKSDII